MDMKATKVEPIPSRIEKVCADSDVRFYLCDAWLDAEGESPLIVATNGHALAIRKLSANGPLKSGQVQRAALEHAAPTYDEYGDEIEDAQPLQVTDDTVTVDRAHFDRSRNEIKYPDWRRVLPPHSEDYDILIDARLLMRLQEALCTPGLTQGLAIRFARKEDGSLAREAAMYIRPYEDKDRDDPDAYGCLMPMRD